MWDTLWLDANLATMKPGGAPYGAIERGAVGVKDGRIAWIGYAADLPGDRDKLAHETRRCATLSLARSSCSTSAGLSKGWRLRM